MCLPVFIKVFVSSLHVGLLKLYGVLEFWHCMLTAFCIMYIYFMFLCCFGFGLIPYGASLCVN